MSFTVSDAENVIANWAQTITAVPFYYLDSNVGRPNGLYGMVRFTTQIEVGTPDEQYSPETILGDPWSQHEVSTKITGIFSINVYRSGARNVIAKLQAGIALILPAEILFNASIGFVKFGTVQDLTQVVEGAQEDRAQIDVTFNLVGYATEDINTIDQVMIVNETFGIECEVKK